MTTATRPNGPRTRRQQSETTSHKGAPPEPAEFTAFADVFCPALRLEDGAPLELYPEQRVMLAEYFSGIRETLILIPKKNGKTTLLAALALYHLTTTDNATCFIAAASRDQATILYDQARGFVRRCEWLQEEVTVKAGYRQIRSKRDAGLIRVLAADADTADGVLPTLALVDELHRHKSDELYAVLRDGLGPRKGQMITISTAGDSLETPLGRMRRAAYARPGMVRDGTYRYVRSPGMAMHEWALDPEDDWNSLKLVKQANPAPWQTLDELRARRESDSMVDWQWKRFACGLWVGGEDSAVSDVQWHEAAQPGLKINPPGEGVHVGIDIGRRHDCTAVVAVAKVGDEFWIEPLAIVYPPDDGTYIGEEEIWAPLAAAAERWPEATFIADPKLGGDLFMERLDRDFPSTRAAVFDQNASKLARMAAQFTEELAAGRIRHPDDPVLNAHVLAAGSRPVGEGWRFTKQRRKKLPIDGLIAAGMALSTLINDDDEPDYGRASWR